MKPAMFREMTHVLGAPPDWNPETRGECLGLPVAVDQQRMTFTSCWVLEPEDVAALANGGRVFVEIVSTSQPPMSIAVRVDR